MASTGMGQFLPQNALFSGKKNGYSYLEGLMF